MYLKKSEYIHIVRLLAILCLLLLIGCSSIPLIVPDMAMQPSHSVQLFDAHGPLTPKQNNEILSRLKKNSVDTHIFDRHLPFESKISGSHLSIGNKVELLIDGPETYKSMYTAMENAKDHINMEIYIIKDDEIGHLFAELLIRKQNSGVQVNLIYDSVGSIDTPREFFKSLKESGVNVLEFNPINPLIAPKNWQVTRRDHRKLLIIDGQIAFVGGVNISTEHSKGSFVKSKSTRSDNPWRDTHVRIVGPVVSEFQKLFMSIWNEQKGELLAARNYFPELANEGSEVVRAIGSSPEKGYSQIYVTLLSAINSAETQIFLTSAYFVPDPQLRTALKAAAKRRVDVRILLPGKTDSALVYYASRSFYDELLSAGVKIYVRQDALLHAKTTLIDGVWSTIGSTNLDWRSFLNNEEIDAIILGQDFGTQMQTLFENDLKYSKLITLEEWRQRSISTRILESAGRLWAQWL
ncbi:cardiolipin synthase [Nitrosomonas communis]|uniref:Cardiolipin synthase n=1 Tax=Nitrosomonas communis TaxID=44574 RepID=A0A1I4QEQ8_9PROT|nr:cardiolipin synthase [Nitrosomonas communis]SFM38548.1 cardiolipin synthase [Nitrosomonas communis]